MASKVLAGLIYRNCELYIDDVLIHATTESDFLINLCQVFLRLREHNVAANPPENEARLDPGGVCRSSHFRRGHVIHG